MLSPSYFPAMAAVELGFFAAVGLDVTLELIAPVDRCCRALRDGAVELVGGSAHAPLAAFAEWHGAKLICAQSRGMYWFLVMRADLAALRGDLNVLRGKRIGAAPWVDLGLRRVLAAAGLDPVRDGIEIGPIPGTLGPKVNVGVVAADALADGRIDGFWANGMGAAVAVRHGVGTVVLDARRDPAPPGMAGYTFAAIATTDRVIAAHPGIAAAVRRAVAATQMALRQDIGLATKVGRALFPPMQAGLIAELVARDQPFYDIAITEASIVAMTQFARDVGVLDTELTYAQVVAA